jgi:hypothetical protein
MEAVEEILQHLKRIADALEASNNLTQDWLVEQKQQHIERHEDFERQLAQTQEWFDWQKARHVEEVARIEAKAQASYDEMINAYREHLQIQPISTVDELVEGSGDGRW